MKGLLLGWPLAVVGVVVSLLKTTGWAVGQEQGQMKSVPCQSLAKGGQGGLVGLMAWILSHDQGLIGMSFQSHNLAP